MRCPKCFVIATSVIDSRESENGAAIRRRRQCNNCQYRFTTYERGEIVNFIVVKKNGTCESYERSKLEKSIWIACQKRPVRRDQVEQIVNSIEETLRPEKEVDSNRIGQLVVKALKSLDDIAYIRYASVYREFKDVASFQKELLRLRR